jgi:CHAT domain-containing protein/Flp pilus assembly protein TadD
MLKKSCLLILLFYFFPRIDVVAQEQGFSDSMMFYYSNGNFNKAIVWGEKYAEAIKQRVGEQDTLYGLATNDLGAFYFLTGDYKTAKSLYRKATAIFKIKYGEKSQQYAVSLNNLARLYDVTGEFSPAESLYIEALKINKELSGEQNQEYAKTLDNLGVLYHEMGNYSLAEKFHLKALAIRRKVLGEENPEYAFSLNNLAALYYFLGNYSAAEPLFRQALSITKKRLGEKHPDYATGLGNLARVYAAINDYDKAESLTKEELKIKKEILGENNPSYALALDNLATLYYSMNKGPITGQLYKEALAIRKKTLGTEHLDYASSLMNLGLYNASIGNDATADSLYKEALIIRRKNLGEGHSDYIQTLKYQSDLYQLMGNYSAANELTLNILAKQKLLLINKLDFLSEKELLEYLKQIESIFTSPYILLRHYYSPELMRAAYTSHLLLKGISIQNTNSLANQMWQSKDSLLVKLWNDYKSNKLLLNKMLTLPITKRIINIDSLNNITNQQEKELLRQSAAFRDMKDKLNTTWQDVRNNLLSNEAAVEFVRFHNLKNEITTPDTVYYAAMLVRPHDTVPVFIKLFDEGKLKSALNDFAYKATEQNSGSKIDNKRNIKINIYNLVWQPLEPYLPKTTTIYFAPDGLLHNLAFAAISYKKGSLLCDKYNLVQLTSTRQVIIKEINTRGPSSIALFGGINYDKQNTDTSISVSADPYSYVYQQNRSGDLDSFAYLPNTLKEIGGIKRNMELKQKKVSFYIGDKATEAAFRNMGGASSPEVIHLATHGFALPDNSKQKINGNTFKISDNPLLRTGLVMAGGNKGWKGKSQLDEDDGILTALEITSVPLQNTQLAVLSACETGIGEFRGSEGVFGLQRAFKIAGVNYIMASLWQVPDKETNEFMNYFYSQWLAGKTIRQSFINTQQTMRKKYSPYYWAAFTLVQ